MDTELLRQILLAVSIVAVIMLVFVFCRLFDILGDVKIVSRLSAKRAEDLDNMITKIERSAGDYLDGFKGFLSSVGFIKNVVNFFEKDKKGERDEKK